MIFYLHTLPQTHYFRNNFVKTSKYEIYNFLPKFLLEEFNPRTKVANCYFLMCAGLQCIPAISNTKGLPTTLIPLLIVVIVDAIFQVLEDLSRHKADTEANSSDAQRYHPPSKDFILTKWSELAVGDFVYVTTRSTIPADIVILGVSEKSEPAQGICYVETKSLDGETNLKMRSALPLSAAKVRDVSALARLTGDIEMEHPNKLIDSFTGVMDLKDIGRDVIQSNNLLLRGCVLRNTDWIIGIVVNTGHDTKIMMSNTDTKGKTSNLESEASKEIRRVIMLLAIVCFAGSTGQAIWNNQMSISDIRYLHYENYGKNGNMIGDWFVKFFYFFLLHATFIPVSLYVSMAVTRSLQSYFMNNDLEMYYAPTDSPAIVRTMTLNEELGQISHVFSDKTGTLTCNIMDFRKASVNGVSYGLGITEIGKAAWKLQNKEMPLEVLEGEAKAKANAVPHVAFYDPKYDLAMKKGGEQKRKLQQFFRLLAICHDVIPERLDGIIKLSASSPDDEALVCAAEYFGYKFCDRRDKFSIVKVLETDTEEEVETLETIEFSSKRKRMSVIVREPNGQIQIMTKGAEVVMFDRLSPGQDKLIEETVNHLNQFATEGLRCLLVAHANISNEVYENWSAQYKIASTSMTEIEKKKRGEKNAIEDLENEIENNLTLLGVTAIEDRLQNGVPECIAALAQAGINIWMLTGDKEETAINIAVACNLVLPGKYMDQIIINKTTAPTKRDMLNTFIKEIRRYDDEVIDVGASAVKPRALVIDGPSLITATEEADGASDLDGQGDNLREMLLELCQRCKAVVGCRVSPDQKREMVNLIKLGVPGVRTLAVGDGANDVAMIQEAHIGVGIKGEEGLQAVNSADFAIAQFRFLSQLILKHGRYNYIRMSSMVCFMFYKNVAMSIAQFWFNFNCGFSGQKYYTEGAIQMYNLLYTSFPILMLGVYDRDVSVENVMKYPRLYQAGIRHEYFKSSIFWSWIAMAMLESVIVSVLPLYLLAGSDKLGNDPTFFDAGATCYTVIIIIVNFKLFFMQTRWYWGNFVIMAASIGLWFASAYLINYIIFFDWAWYYIFIRLTSTTYFWLTVILLVTVVVGKDIYICALERSFNYKPYQILQEMEVLAAKNVPSTSTNRIISSEPVEDADIELPAR